MLQFEMMLSEQKLLPHPFSKWKRAHIHKAFRDNLLRQHTNDFLPLAEVFRNLEVRFENVTLDQQQLVVASRS